jgi:hypothetical protein
VAHIYFDESIHDRGGFIVGAYVYGPDAQTAVTAAICRVGLDPETDEFKSSARMDKNPRQNALRAELRGVLRSYRIGVLVIPRWERAALGEHALRGLDQIAIANSLSERGEIVVALDEGLFPSTKKAADLCASIGIDQYCTVLTEQDSRIVQGLQLADLVAHTGGTMLLETLGLVEKSVVAGPNSGYDEDSKVDLGFELWASMRYQFFHSGPVKGQADFYGGALMEVGNHGLYISPACEEWLRNAALERFGQCYLGCIH